jgi:NAD(P)-dependent dehydrogenase (short-subunit alcohol dehydrogenase family)
MFDASLFKNKVVLVSGAAGGVGSATARRLHGCGANLSLTSCNAERLVRLAAELDAHATVADMSKVGDCGRIIDETIGRYGRLDAVVNCAGVWVEGESEAATESDWNRCLDVNLKGAFFLCSRAIPALKSSRGAIVNVSSDAGLVGNAGCAIYCASKGGVNLMSKSLALELAPFGVRVNAVCPSDIMSPMLRGQAVKYGSGSPDAYLNNLLARYPQRQHARFIEADEVACLIIFLLTGKAAPITGASLSIDFGITAGY